MAMPSDAAKSGRRMQTRSQSNKRLCARCVTLDLDSIFRQSFLDPDRNWIMGDPQPEGPMSESCTLCSLLVSTYGKERRGRYQGSYYKLRSVSSAGIKRRGWNSINTIMLAPSWTRLPDVFLVPQAEGAEAVRLLPPLLSSNDEFTHWVVFKHWIGYCRQHHTTLCHLPTDCDLGSISSLRVIDCETDRLVRWSGRPYATLSYVWGVDSTAPPFSLEQLPETKPQTVQDAIIATLALGLRYLWVDRYCINQSNPSEVASQVSKMDLIYRGSEVTLIAAAGHNADYGLPGVSRPRRPQPHATIGKHHLVSSLPDPTIAVQKSKWWTRGWTYQEGLLARRRLVFTDQQVYFECGGMYCCEAIHVDLDALHTRDGRRFRACYYPRESMQLGWSSVTESYLFPRLQHFVDEAKDAWVITEIISEYSNRSLGKAEDVLNAWRGVAGARKGMRHLFGTPVIGRAPMPRDYPNGFQEMRRRIYDAIKWSPVIGFCLGLCWQVQRPMARRDGFPSWSWAGWKAEDGEGGWVSGPVTWLFDESTWRSLQGAVDLRLRVQLCDDGRVLEWEDFERQYDALSSRLSGTLRLSARAIPGRVVGSDGERCDVDLDGGGGAWHRWTFPLTDRGFSTRGPIACLAIPLAGRVERGAPVKKTCALLVVEIRPGVYQRIGADTWEYDGCWSHGKPPPTQETRLEFELE